MIDDQCNAVDVTLVFQYVTSSNSLGSQSDLQFFPPSEIRIIV